MKQLPTALFALLRCASVQSRQSWMEWVIDADGDVHKAPPKPSITLTGRRCAKMTTKRNWH